MREISKKMCLLLGGTVLVGMLSAAVRADSIPVEYSTTGTFTGGGSSISSGSASISFAGVSDLNISTPDLGALFGNFTSSQSTTIGTFTGDSFTLTVTETIPGSYSGPITASLTGSLVLGPGGTGVTVAFGGKTLALPTPPVTGVDEVLYSPYDTSIGTGGQGGTEALNGSIDSIAAGSPPGAPLPASVFGGGALTGGSCLQPDQTSTR